MTTSQSRTLACLIALFCVATLLSLSVASADTAPVKRTYTDNPRVLIETTQGNIEQTAAQVRAEACGQFPELGGTGVLPWTGFSSGDSRFYDPKPAVTMQTSITVNTRKSQYPTNPSTD